MTNTPMTPRKYRYIKNGKPFESDSPIYYFEWAYKPNCAVYFGFHGTEDDYEVNWRQDPMRHSREMIRRVPVPEV